MRPARVFFFSEASLAHETACALRDSGDMAVAAEQFQLSARKRKATTSYPDPCGIGYLSTGDLLRRDLPVRDTLPSTAGLHTANHTPNIGQAITMR
ncbi:hypothetical protein ACWEO2_21145 [Nocardia sp. NPDC004278]